MANAMSVQRDDKGRFLPGGAPKSPGRPRREVEAKYLNVMLGAVSEDDWRKVVAAMTKQAQRGNVAAATWLANYLQGKPQERVDITSNDETIAAPVVYLPKVDDGSTQD